MFTPPPPNTPWKARRCSSTSSNPGWPKVKQIARQRLKKVMVSWEEFERQGEIVLDLFRQSAAKYLVRIGDREHEILRKNQQTAWLPNLVAAIRYTDCLGLYRSRSVSEQDIIDTLRDHQVEIERSVPRVNANIFARMPELVGKISAGKKVLWITSDADAIVSNLANPSFRDFYGLHGIVDNDWINAAHGGFTSAFPRSITVEQAFSDIQQQLTRVRDFDLAIVGAGVTGKLVCHYIKSNLGKSAIDIGVCISYFKGTRERPSLNPGDSIGIYYLVWDPAANNPSDTHD